MGVDYSFYVKTIETHARTFLALNILAIGMVLNDIWQMYFDNFLKQFCHPEEL